MADDINFLDLMALKRITSATVVEKFGGLINSSFFDASNILGTLKLKGLVDFTTIVPGQNAITITEIGNQLMKDADQKAIEQFDQLDLTILRQLVGGKRSFQDLNSVVNIRPKDLAMRLYKLTKQEYMTSEFRNGNIDTALTEKGFMQAQAGMPPPQAIQQQGQVSPEQNVESMQPELQQQPEQFPQPAQAQQMQQSQTQQEAKELKDLEKQLASLTRKRRLKIIITILVVAIVIVFSILIMRGIIVL